MFDIHSLTSFGKNKISSIPCTYIETKTTESTTQKKAELSYSPKSKSAKNKTFSRFISKISSLSSQHKFTFNKSKDCEEFLPKQELDTQSPKYDAISMVSFQIDSTATEYAQRIWDQDKTVYEDLCHVVEWIGNGKASSQAILKAYMAHFDFKDLKLEQAFRTLCSKLHLKGETQQIDRILYEFADRYFGCNPQCIFGTIDVVYSVIYSILLLNTDLHVAQGDYKKMTRAEFVNNTMDAIRTQVDSPEYIDDNTSGISLSRTSSSNSESIASMPRNISSWTLGSKSWDTEIKNTLKQIYSNIRNQQIADPSSNGQVVNNRVSVALKRSIGSIMWKNNSRYGNEDESISSGAPSTITCPSIASTKSSNSMAQYQSVTSQLQFTEIPSTVPYYMEGLVSRKHLLEKSNQKAKHRDWRGCFMVVDRSQLHMYKVESTRSQLIGSIDLKHSLANALPSGYSRQRQHAFSLQQSNGAVHLFQVESEEKVHEWVATCNYWAARESKGPLTGGVSSMEYGWGPQLEKVNESIANINEWQAPCPPMMTSTLEESAQYNALSKYVCELSTELDLHRDLKPKMELRFSGSSKFEIRAMTNWENKSHYLLHEIIKYQNYCDSIEKSLAMSS